MLLQRGIFNLFEFLTPQQDTVIKLKHNLPVYINTLVANLKNKQINLNNNNKCIKTVNPYVHGINMNIIMHKKREQ